MTSIATPDCIQNPTENSLYTWCEENGIFIVDNYVFGEATDCGFYHSPTRSIYISRSLPQYWYLPTLAHEIIHAYNEHDGHQPQCVENRIDEAVARAFINPQDYAYWEDQYGWRTGGIAKELDMPRWVVEAYRRLLTKQLRNTLERNPYGIDIVA